MHVGELSLPHMVWTKINKNRNYR